MAGLLTHLAVSSALLVIVLIIFRKFLYGCSIFIGQLIPDVIKFGITGIKLKTTSFYAIVKDSLFWKLEALTSSYHTWVTLGILIICASFFLCYIRKIKKEHVKEINWNYLMLVIGVSTHLIIDILVIERNYWV